MQKIRFILMILAAIFVGVLNSCTPAYKQERTTAISIIQSNIDAQGTRLSLEFYKGRAHNHPSFAIWLEDLEGNFIQTIFTTRYVATGIYGHGELESGKWKPEPGEAVRPATLPYWAHKRGQLSDKIPDLPSPKNPLADAISGATPSADFILQTKADKILPRRFRVLLEINQAWDSNRYWTNNKFPDDFDYMTSLQPALVYAVTIDLDSDISEYFLNPIGHSHYSGKNGLLYTDLSTLTTALEIVGKVIVKIDRQVQ